MAKRFFSIRTWTWINLVCFALAAGTEKLVAEQAWPGILLITLPAYALLLLPLIVLATSLLKRKAKPIFVNLAVLVVSLLVYLAPALSINRSDAKPNLKVLTYNIKLGEMGIEGLLETIRKESPDIVCLQESRLHGNKQVEDWFKTMLREYSIIRNGDMSIASKHRIESVRLIPLTDNGENRKAQAATVVIGNARLTVINAHLMHAHFGDMQSDPLHLPSILTSVFRTRERQAKELLAAAKQIEGPVVICGDFNNPAQGLIYRSFRESFTDAWATTNAGLGYTFASGFPYARIDYVWTNRQIVPVRCEVLNVKHSDHRPLAAELCLAQR